MTITPILQIKKQRPENLNDLPKLVRSKTGIARGSGAFNLSFYCLLWCIQPHGCSVFPCPSPRTRLSPLIATALQLCEENSHVLPRTAFCRPIPTVGSTGFPMTWLRIHSCQPCHQAGVCMEKASTLSSHCLPLVSPISCFRWQGPSLCNKNDDMTCFLKNLIF